MPSRPTGSAFCSSLADPGGSPTLAMAGAPAMRPLSFGLLAILVGAGLLAPHASAWEEQERTIILDFDVPEAPRKLPPPPSQPAIKKPAPVPSPPPAVKAPPAPPSPALKAPPAPAPEYHPIGYPPVNYCPHECADESAVWASAELLLWWIRRQPLPPLVTAGPARAPGAGLLGSPASALVVGGGGINGNAVLGGRFSAGAWFDDDHTAGAQVSYLFLGDRETTLTVASNGATRLFRPVFDLATHRSVAVPLAAPGGAVVGACSEGLQGINALFRENVYGTGERGRPSWARVDVALGYSYLTLQEGLMIQADLPPGAPGNSLVGTDLFHTRNEFHGGQAGFLAELRQGELVLQGEALLAMGATLQSALVEGSTPGALLAQPGNAGLHHRSTFSVVPQLGLKAAWQVSSWLRLSLAYNALLWTGVARPGDQVNLAVNPVRGTVPFAFRDSSLWVQGLGLGLEVCYGTPGAFLADNTTRLPKRARRMAIVSSRIGISTRRSCSWSPK